MRSKLVSAFQWGNVNPGGLNSLFTKHEIFVLTGILGAIPNGNRMAGSPLQMTAVEIFTLGKRNNDSDKQVPIPFFFLDQSDFSKPDYAVASGLWKFVFPVRE